MASAGLAANADMLIRLLLEKDAAIQSLSTNMGTMQQRMHELETENEDKALQLAGAEELQRQAEAVISSLQTELQRTQARLLDTQHDAEMADVRLQRVQAECDAVRVKLLEVQRENKLLVAQAAMATSSLVPPIASASKPPNATSYIMSFPSTPFNAPAATPPASQHSTPNAIGITDITVPTLQGTQRDALLQRRNLAERPHNTLLPASPAVNVSLGSSHSIGPLQSPPPPRKGIAATATPHAHQQAVAFRTALHAHTSTPAFTTNTNSYVSSEELDARKQAKQAAAAGAEIRHHLEQDLARIARKEDTLRGQSPQPLSDDAAPAPIKTVSFASLDGMAPNVPTVANATPRPAESSSFSFRLREYPTPISPALASLARITKDVDDFTTSNAILRLTQQISSLETELVNLQE
jgi:hypothetical protein